MGLTALQERIVHISTLKMEAVCPYETYQTACHSNPEVLCSNSLRVSYFLLFILLLNLLFLNTSCCAFFLSSYILFIYLMS